MGRLGRARVPEVTVRLLILQWLPCPGAPESWGRRARFAVLMLWMLKGLMAGVVGDMIVQRGGAGEPDEYLESELLLSESGFRGVQGVPQVGMG